MLHRSSSRRSNRCQAFLRLAILLAGILQLWYVTTTTNQSNIIGILDGILPTSFHDKETNMTAADRSFHYPSSWNPQDSADMLRSCMKRHGILWRDHPGKTSDWAGHFVYNTYPKNATATAHNTVVLGPLIPKAGSTTLRQLSGHLDRPVGLRKRYDLPNNETVVESFRVAIVRHPLDHFLSIYRQNGDGNFTKGPMRNWAVNYCNLSTVERKDAFGTFLHRFLTQDPRNRNEHNIPQLHYLQNYVYTNDGVNTTHPQPVIRVPVVDRIHALLHLEDFSKGWILATEQARQGSGYPNTTNGAVSWMQEKALTFIPREDGTPPPKNRFKERDPLPEWYKKFSFARNRFEQADQDWKPLCGEDGSLPYFRFENVTQTNNETMTILVDGIGNRLDRAQDYASAIHFLRYHYGRKYIRAYIAQLCDYLQVDLECLQYELPAECRSP